MTAFDELRAIRPHALWDGVAARVVQGERITLAVVELDPGAVVPEHAHEQEQLGIVLQGTVNFRVADEMRGLGPGETWRILANVPHEVVAGPDGATVIDVFSPVRADWSTLDQKPPRTPRWP